VTKHYATKLFSKVILVHNRCAIVFICYELCWFVVLA